MLDTYDSAADAEADRKQQKALLSALGASDLALRRDECGAWRINGKHGSVHTHGDGTSWTRSDNPRPQHQSRWQRRLQCERRWQDIADAYHNGRKRPPLSRGSLHTMGTPSDGQAAQVRHQGYQTEQTDARRAASRRGASAR
jgi:hypothetical protein